MIFSKLAIVAQCPCIGGRAIDPLLLLAIVAGIWLLARWVRSVLRKEGVSKMNRIGKIVIVIVLVAAVAAVIAVKYNQSGQKTAATGEAASVGKVARQEVPAKNYPAQLIGKGLPALIDLGAGQCIPCKMMAPILEQLKKEYAGRLEVEFIDVWKNPHEAERYGIKLIPTQIFFDASGKELFRHEGFFSKEDILAKWKELGVDLSGSKTQSPTFERLTPAQPDNRPKENICYMCDGDINPKTLVTVRTEKGPVRLCSPHCYFIMYSCLTEDKTDFDKKVSVADWVTAEPIAAAEAMYLYGLDGRTGRPTIKAFTNKIQPNQATSGAIVIGWQVLQEKELATRCGFCDRAVYAEDAAVVKANGLSMWGCCSHCALGVAARTGSDIEVHDKDRLTGEKIIVKTFGGQVTSLEPATAVAWFGQRQKSDGTWASAGCFHQGFFINAENLKKWVEQNPYETGRLISINQALADKMKMSPEQIQKACKIGECSPK
ncbi:MAG: organomercurial lyase [Sedimentisphaerales bacterium]|nr:organomercurial lyase [Sedimentisphaerales bacterium]